jgi:hypothetical protein
MASTKATLDPSEKTQLGPLAPFLVKTGAVVGVLGLIGAAAWGAALGDDMRRFFFAYLLAVCFFLTIACGGLFVVLLHHLTRSIWSVMVRRIAEVLTATFPLLALLILGIAIPILLGYHGLYEWSDHEIAHQDHLIHAKIGWLNPTFFAIRCVIYSGIWIVIAHYFRTRSVAQDGGKRPELSESMRIASAPAMLGFALATAFASFDLLMSLEPRWFSTIFPVYFFAGCAISIYAVLALIPQWLQRRGIISTAFTVEHYHDVGKLLFAFVFFWGYIAFSQFMLIWYANIPEETFWYAYRMEGSWAVASILLLFGHFLLPFVALMSRHTKRRSATLAFMACWMLVAHWFDLFWIIMPEYDPQQVSIHPIDLLAFAGVGGLFVAVAARAATGISLVPVDDPRLGEALALQNM